MSHVTRGITKAHTSSEEVDDLVGAIVKLVTDRTSPFEGKSSTPETVMLFFLHSSRSSYVIRLEINEVEEAQSSNARA